MQRHRRLAGVLGALLFFCSLAARAQPVPSHESLRGLPTLPANQFFVRSAQLVPSDAPVTEIRSIALSDDGRTALLGVPGQDCSAGADCGAAYVFVRNGDTWSQMAKLVGTGLQAGDLFGSSVALSGDGRVALISSQEGTCVSPIPCGAFVFVRQGDSWVQEARLAASGHLAGSLFPHTVALSQDGSTALVAEPEEECPPFCGTVHVFTRAGGLWTEQAVLRREPDEPGQFFGRVVDLSDDGNVAVATGFSFQPVYVFVRQAGVWSIEKRIELPPGDIELSPGSTWSLSLAGDGSTLLTGSPDSVCDADFHASCGAAFAFARQGGAWGLEQIFVDGVQGDQLGLSVAISDDGNTGVLGGFGDHRWTLVVGRVGAGLWSERQGLATNALRLALSGDGATLLDRSGNVFILASIAQVPTVGEVGLLGLALLLAASGAVLLGRRRRMA